MYDVKELGSKVREARRLRSKKSAQEITPKVLAYKIGETTKWVQKLENGDFYPDWDALNFIAEICGVTVEFLTGEEFEDRIEYEDATSGGKVAQRIDQDELYAP